MNKPESFYVITGYTFFYWGFDVPKRHHHSYINYFNLSRQKLQEDIVIKIKSKKHKAKIKLVKQDNQFGQRDVVQIFYPRNINLTKALRNEFIYSYAATINKAKSKLKEIMELSHSQDNEFKIKAIAKQDSDFNEMFRFMENKNLFEYWQNEKKGKKNNKLFIYQTKNWISVNDLKKYSNRNNVIYLLYHSKKKEIYIGQAQILGNRVTKGKGRKGLDDDWDKFKFFELNPEYSNLIDFVEMFSVRMYASILENQVGIKELKDKSIKLVNLKLDVNK